MKWTVLIVLIASVIVIPALGEDRIKEGFEGPVFPPRAWTTFVTGPGEGEGSWSKGANETGYCAYGTVYCTYPQGYLDAVLCTSYRILFPGDYITISFDLKTEDSSGGSLSIRLWTRSNSCFWDSYVDKPPIGETRHYTYNLPVIIDSNDYQFRWYLESWYQSVPVSITVSLDNITVKRTAGSNQTQMEPSTLGRIKSAYK